MVSTAHPLDKQVWLKFYGSLAQSELTVELQIFNQGDRNQPLVSLPLTVTVNEQLQEHIVTLWEQHYRPLFRGRTIKIQGVETHRVDRQACEQSAQTLGIALNDWLQTPDFQPIRESLLRELNPDDRIQVLVQTRDRTLQQLPWPHWQLFQDYPHATISQSAPDVKRPPTGRDRANEQNRDRLRILGIFGASEDIDTHTDQELLRALPSHLVEVQILDQPDRAAINHHLWEQHWDIILFAGHGQTTEDGEGVLYLNEAGDTLALNDIWYGLRQAVRSGLKLALFNSCAGLGLLARNLQDDAQIPHMIVMRDVVPDVVAQAFLSYFLGEFAKGESITVAANRARQRLQGLEQDYPCASWLPVIWQNPYAIPFGLLSASESIPKPEAKAKSSVFSLIRLVPLNAVGWGFVGIMIVVLGLRPPVAHWFSRQGQLADTQQEFIKAKRYLKIAAILKPSDVYSRYLLGSIYQDQGDFDAALHWHYAALKLGMPEAIAEYVRLRLLQAQNDHQPLSELDYSTLLKHTKFCIEQTPYEGTEASCFKNRGWIHMEQQRWPRAVESLAAAIALREDSAHTHCLLAQALEYQGLTEEAKTHWHKTTLLAQDHILEQGICLRLAEERPP